MRLGSRSALVFFIGGGLRGRQMETASSGRKKLGAYYTPNHIVRTLFDEARAVIVGDGSSTGLATLGVCDPACGAGQFLVTWFEELVSAEVGIAKELADNVYGVDLDPVECLVVPCVVLGSAVCERV